MRAERAALYNLSDSEVEWDDGDDTLGGFIVHSDDSSDGQERTKSKVCTCM